MTHSLGIDTATKHEPSAAANESSIDLSGSNTLRQLLEERQSLTETLRDTKDRIGEIDEIIRRVMGDAAIGTLPGWVIYCQTIKRKEHLVMASEYRRLTIKPTAEGA